MYRPSGNLALQVLEGELVDGRLTRLEEDPGHREVPELRLRAHSEHQMAVRVVNAELGPALIVERAVHADVLVGCVVLDDQLGRRDRDLLPVPPRLARVVPHV